MNTGVISNRYAKAFLSLTIESGRSKEVYAQVQDILSGKIPETVEKDIDSLIALLKKNGRIPYLKYILFNYCSQYRKWAGIVQASLEVAAPSDKLESQLRELLQRECKGDVVFTQKVNPDLIGGFVLEVNDKVIDTSVKSKLATIRIELDEMNKRLV
ncbi:MAG: F0F1 ATP synthase subunit delta [Bacteroidales bacterium]|nr:F0F1 ATP synthase subunit delta [Bacteroidales bacterium]